MELADVDLVDLDRFAAGFPHETFDFLRRHAPVWWHPPSPKAPGGEGFWVVSRHADVLAVLRDPATFSSEGGGSRSGGGTTLDDLPRGIGPGAMLNMMDPPRHDAIRLLVNKGMKPSTIAKLEDGLRARTRAILDDVVPRGNCDFLREVAAELPLQVTAGLFGVPQDDRHKIFEWTTAFVDYADRDLGQSSARLARAAAELAAYGGELIAAKRERPGDDMLSIAIHAEMPEAPGRPRRLEDRELLAFLSLLLVAGAETTRNAIAGGLLALIERPESMAALRAERALLGTSVEEILRWTAPTAYNRRTATRDVELGGQKLRAGDKVTHWYPSANRDEAVFADPARFDVRRDPNPHLSFGHGVHHCLGASLARSEIRIALEELFARVDSIELDGPVEWARSNKHTGIRRMPVRWRACS
ncbi:MAG TPA: cytochrome P450 [Myxococcota bacterium]|nr:cytochrome P450 [Myxococcota bacterium]